MSGSISRDFVIMGLQPWDIEIGSNCKNIALELSKNHRVLYINRALDRFSLLRHYQDQKVKNRLEAIKGKKGALQKKNDNLWVLNPPVILESIGWIGPNILFDYFNKINSKRLGKVVNENMDRLDFSDAIILIDNDFYRGPYFKDLIPKTKTVYYIRDYLIEQPYFKKHGKRYEQKMIQEADIVFANSSYLATYASKHNHKSYDIGQGCDLRDFKLKTRSVPRDLAKIKGPIIGYVGALLSSRLDIEVIRYIAEKKSEWSVVLVGPEDEAFNKSNLHDLPNIYFLGRKAKERIPDYIAHFDVCFNPQSINPSTIGNYPRKIDEYLAMGKPVVATATEAMNMFEEYVYLCSSGEEYIASIHKALNERDGRLSDLRVVFAFSHSWENSVGKMEQYMREILN